MNQEADATRIVVESIDRELKQLEARVEELVQVRRVLKTRPLLPDVPVGVSPAVDPDFLEALRGLPDDFERAKEIARRSPDRTINYRRVAAFLADHALTNRTVENGRNFIRRRAVADPDFEPGPAGCGVLRPEEEETQIGPSVPPEYEAHHPSVAAADSDAVSVA